MAELAEDPWTNNRTKFDLWKPPLVARVYQDGRFRIIYQLVRYDREGPWIVDVMAISGPAIVERLIDP